MLAWHDAIEHGQVLAGTVAYPPGHPIGMYYLKAYSLADHLSALWLAAGLSQAWLACVLQVLKGAVFYAGLALCTFGLTSRVGWSVLSPLVWSAYQLGRFSDAYPVTPIDHPNTNGFLGAAVLLLALGLMATRRRFTGGLAMGVLPYVHVAFGAFGWVAGCLWCLVDRPTRRQIVGFCSGAAIFAVSFGWHQLHFARPSVVSAGLADYYFHDSAVTPDSGWLDQRGEMVVYVPRAGEYRLHAEIAPVGEQRLRIVPADSATAEPVYRLTGNQSSGFSEFQSAPVHLKAGVNFVDLRCDGAAGDIGGGRRASIGFKEMRWETVGNGS